MLSKYTVPFPTILNWNALQMSTTTLNSDKSILAFFHVPAPDTGIVTLFSVEPPLEVLPIKKNFSSVASLVQ